MPGDLTPEQVRELVEQFGSLEAAAAEALTRSGYAEELRVLRTSMTYAGLRQE